MPSTGELRTADGALRRDLEALRRLLDDIDDLDELAEVLDELERLERLIDRLEVPSEARKRSQGFAIMHPCKQASTGELGSFAAKLVGPVDVQLERGRA